MAQDPVVPNMQELSGQWSEGYRWEKILPQDLIDTLVQPDKVLVTPSEFEAMRRTWGEYSCSYPTGIYEGKKWLRNQAAYNRPFGEDWYLAEIVRWKDDNELGIVWRKVVLDLRRMANEVQERLSQ